MDSFIQTNFTVNRKGIQLDGHVVHNPEMADSYYVVVIVDGMTQALTDAFSKALTETRWRKEPNLTVETDDTYTFTHLRRRNRICFVEDSIVQCFRTVSHLVMALEKFDPEKDE